MYQCIIPPRIFLAVGVGLLIFSLVFGWICFSVPDWLQFYEQTQTTNLTSTNTSQINNDLVILKKFGLWYKCMFSTVSNDFLCILWNNDAPSNITMKRIVFICFSFFFLKTNRFCPCCSSFDPIWFIIRMFIIFLCNYWFYDTTSIYYNSTLCSIICLSEL